MGWDWGIALGVIGIVIGFVALAVAVPSAAQMLWGRPKVRMSFGKLEIGRYKALGVSVENAPIESALLRRIGARREPAEIGAHVTVYDAHGVEAAAFVPKLTGHDGKSALQVRVPPATVITFLVVICDKDGARGADDDDNGIPLAAGHYEIEVALVMGDEMTKASRPLHVREPPDETVWG